MPGLPADALQPQRVANRRHASALDATAFTRLVGLLLLAVAAWTVIDFPVGPWALTLGLVLYAAVLLRFPTLTYLIAIPLLLPVLDLAPVSGRFFWDEFDVLLAATLGMRLLLPLPPRQRIVPPPSAALWLLFASVLASAVVGVWPLVPVDMNAFSNYLSTYNALRILKGYVWAGALLWLIGRDAAAGRNVVAQLQIGLALGLLAATVTVFWGQLAFVGWLNLGSPFRAAGIVSATHVGGAYLEAMLVLLAPFGLALAAADRPVYRVIWRAVVLLGAGAVLMTLSRAALVAWLVAVAAFAIVGSWKSRESRGVPALPRWRWGAGFALLGFFAVTVLAAQSTYLRGRLAMSNADLSVRAAHWKQTVDLMRSDALHVVLGMGLGSFPREFYLAQAWTQQLPGYRLEQDAGSLPRYLVLTGGRGMYMDQRVAASPGSELRLRGQVRSAQAGASLSVSLCEKSLLNSVGCDEVAVPVNPTWEPFEVRLAAPQRAKFRLTPTAPLSLSLHNGVFGSRVEVTQLSLLDGPADLLSNGSFEHGLDRWFVTSDVHLAWRVLNTPLQIAFEQGLLGVLAWLAMGAAAIAIVRRPSTVPGAAAAFAAAMVGLLVVGCFDSLLDSPRVILLIALVWAAGLNASDNSSSRPVPIARVVESREEAL